MKRMFILVSLAVIIGLSAFVIAEAWAGEMPEQSFENGWNLVYGLITPNQFDGQVLDKSNIKAIYGFVPTIQKYVRLYPVPAEGSEDSEILSSIEGEPYDFEEDFSQTGFWVYSGQDAKSEYWLLRNEVPLNERKIFAGWNFVGITSDMVGKTFTELKGSCNIEKAYFYNSMLQKWLDLYAEDLINKAVQPELISQVLVLKVTNNCQLGTAGLPSVPQLPQ